MCSTIAGSFYEKKKEGAILFTGGCLALNPMPEYTTISINKAALRALVITLHKELGPDGIFVGIVNVRRST